MATAGKSKQPGASCLRVGVACSITYAVGYAFTELSERLLLAEIEGGDSSLNKVLNNAADIFKKQFDVE